MPFNRFKLIAFLVFAALSSIGLSQAADTSKVAIRYVFKDQNGVVRNEIDRAESYEITLPPATVNDREARTLIINRRVRIIFNARAWPLPSWLASKASHNQYRAQLLGQFMMIDRSGRYEIYPHHDNASGAYGYKDLMVRDAYDPNRPIRLDHFVEKLVKDEILPQVSSTRR